MTYLAELAQPLTAFDDVVHTLGIQLHTDLEVRDIQSCLTEVSAAVTALSETGFNEKRQAYKLSTQEKGVTKEALLNIVDGKRIELAWGREAPISKSDVASVCQILVETLSIQPLAISYIDTKYAAISKAAFNHYEAISEAFFKDEWRRSLAANGPLVGVDFENRISLDSSRVLVLLAVSNVADSEVVNGNYDDDTFQAVAGIAQTRGIPPKANLFQTLVDHIEYAEALLSSKVIDTFFEPLNRIFERNLS